MQKRYLKEVALVHRRYRLNPIDPSWDHDHCDFCFATFSMEDNPDYLKEGYTTENDYHWICPKCFHDFKDEFQWQVREEIE